MKRVISFLFAMSSIMSFAQQLDGYNCIFLNSHTNNQWGLDDRIKSSFIEKGFKVVTSQDEISKNPNERLATLELTYSFEIKYGGTPFNFKLVNMLGEKVFEAEGVGNTLSAKADANRACKRALGKMEALSYNYDPSKTPKLPTPTTEKSSWTESKIKEYLSSVEIDEIEGIYKNIGGSFYKLAILEDNGRYLAIVMDTDCPNWFVGSVKIIFEKLKDKFYNTSYYNDNYSRLETISKLDADGVLKIGDYSYMKIFPISK